MIADWFLNALTGILGPLIDALPRVGGTVPWGTLDGQFNDAAQALARIDAFVPVLEQLQFLWNLLGAFAALLAFKVGVFVWRLVRG